MTDFLLLQNRVQANVEGRKKDNYLHVVMHISKRRLEETRVV
jgi:hypothetical protein